LHTNGDGGIIAYHARIGDYQIDKITFGRQCNKTTFIAGNLWEDIAEHIQNLINLGMRIIDKRAAHEGLLSAIYCSDRAWLPSAGGGASAGSRGIRTTPLSKHRHCS